MLEQKVCLRCGAKIDEINEFTKNYIEGKLDKRNRQKQASQLFSRH